jgi:hypothetical protein
VPESDQARPPDDAIQQRSDTPRINEHGEITREPVSRRPEPPRRRRREEEGYGEQAPNGLATASLVLGLLSFPCSFGLFTSIPAIITGILALRKVSRGQGQVGGKGSAIAGLVLGCLGLLVIPTMFLAISRVRQASTRVQDQNNLKQMALAMHNHHDTYGTFPAATAYRTKDGKPGLSWRVALLPFVEQSNLYRQFKLDESWDSPHNIQLLALMPKVYLQPGQAIDRQGLTHYQVLVGPGTVFEPLPGQDFRGPRFPGMPEKGLTIPSITDGTSNTILIATAARPVPWTKPEDLPFDPNSPLPALGGQLSAGFNVALADGSTRWLPSQTPEPTLRLLITRNDGQMIPNFP